MSKRILFLVLASLFTFELYIFSSYFPIKAESIPREDVFAEMFNHRYIDEKPSVKGVYVNYDSNVEYMFVRANTPLEALENLGYRIGSNNKVSATCGDEELLNNSIITVQTYRIEVKDETFSIPFETITNGSSLCSRLSRTTVAQAGVLGVMTQRTELVYLGDELIEEKIVEKKVVKEPVTQILSYTGANHTPTSAQNLGYNCNHWNSVVDSLSATEEEKRWLKFTMKLESGCNAESNKAYYKGLFQWGPCLWYKLYPKDNIFDGYAQIRRTLEKVRSGGNPKYMWPAVYKKYVAKYGELSWLK